MSVTMVMILHLMLLTHTSNVSFKDEYDLILATERFKIPSMKLNNDRYQLLLSGYKHEMMLANIGQSQIWESKDKDRYMKFDEYIRKEALRTEEFVNFIPKASKVCYESIYRIPSLHTALFYEWCFYFRAFYGAFYFVKCPIKTKDDTLGLIGQVNKY